MKDKEVENWLNSTNEQLAIAVGNSKTRLKEQLISARSCLNKEFKGKFKIFQLDFEKKCMWSEDNSMALQWRLREVPSEPESYNNQQTNVGCVVCIDAESVVI